MPCDDDRMERSEPLDHAPASIYACRQESMLNLYNLPKGIEVMVCMYLQVKDLQALVCVCSRLHEAISRNEHLWQQFIRILIGLPENSFIEPYDRSETLKSLALRSNHFNSLPSRLDDQLLASEVDFISPVGCRLRMSVPIGGDRCVRADKPYHVVLPSGPEDNSSRFRVDNIGSGIYKCLELKLEYFEITLGDAKTDYLHSRTECVAIGLCWGRFPLNGFQPGWQPGSWGYHSDDGIIYASHSKKVGTLPQFNFKGATVGCGMVRNEVQYSGVENRCFPVFFVGPADKSKVSGSSVVVLEIPFNRRLQYLYPVIGLDSHREVKVNFGNEPFVHNIHQILQDKLKTLSISIYRKKNPL